MTDRLCDTFASAFITKTLSCLHHHISLRRWLYSCKWNPLVWFFLPMGLYGSLWALVPQVLVTHLLCAWEYGLRCSLCPLSVARRESRQGYAPSFHRGQNWCQTSFCAETSQGSVTPLSLSSRLWSREPQWGLIYILPRDSKKWLQRSIVSRGQN